MKAGRPLYWGSLLICTAGLLLCGGVFLRQWGEYLAGERAYSKLMETAVFQRELWTEQGAEPEEKVFFPQVDFQVLEAINPDVVGWLYCPETVISYPVVQGEDNTYYLDHLFDGTKNSAGCLFLDSGCTALEGKNSIIYGHNMKNGTLFASLKEYQSQAYYEAHPDLLLITPEGTLTIRLFSAYTAAADSRAWQTVFSSEEEYNTWLQHLLEQSCFDGGAVPTTSDRIITLSTCSYAFQDARFVCHGLVQEG